MCQHGFAHCATIRSADSPHYRFAANTFTGREAFKRYVKFVREELVSLAQEGRRAGRLSRKQADRLRGLQERMNALRFAPAALGSLLGYDPNMPSLVQYTGTTTVAAGGSSAEIDVWTDATSASFFYSIATTTNWQLDGAAAQLTSGSFNGGTPYCCSVLTQKVIALSASSCFTLTANTNHLVWQRFPNPPGEDQYESSPRISNDTEEWGCGGGGGGGGVNCDQVEFTIEVGYYNESGGITWVIYDTFMAEVCEYET